MSRPATVAETILDGNGYIYKRPRSSLWQCRFKVGKEWVIKSTGEKDRKAAIEKAQELFFEAKFRHRDGLPVAGGKTFKLFANEVIKQLTPNAKPKNTPQMHINRIKNHLIPFFGAKRINNVTTADIKDFHDKLRTDAGKELSSNTIMIYNSSINLVFQRALDTKAITRAEIPDMPISGLAKQQRPGFTEAEFNALCKHMLTWCEADGLTKPQLARRALLRTLVYFIANTGVRTGTEINSMTWSGVKLFETNGEKYASIYVSGKTGPRTLVAKAVVVQLLETLKTDATHEITPTTKVFLMTNGKPLLQPDAPFKELLISAGLLIDPITSQERTLYSLRHYYITKSLLAGVPIMTLAQQCGTSVAMIEKHYSKLTPVLAVEQIVQKK